MAGHFKAQSMKRKFYLAAWLLMGGVIAASEPALAPGTKLWEFPAGAPVQSSPALAVDGTIYFGADNGAVYALTPEGRKKWELRTSAGVVATPAVGADGTVYVASVDRIFYAVKPDGTEAWRLMPGSGLVSSPAIGPTGILYVGSVFGQLFAIHPLGYKAWDFPANGNIISSPAVDRDGCIYFGSYDTNFYAVNTNGARKWLFTTQNRISSSPALGSDGTLYFGGFDGQVYAVDKEGELKWAFATGDSVRASPIIGPDGTVYIGSDDGKMYALTQEGKKKWAFATQGMIRATPALDSEGTLYFGAYDGIFYAVKSDGTLKWSFKTGEKISSSAVISPNGVVYFGSWDAVFYAVYGGAPPAKSDWPMFRQNAQRTGCPVRKGPVAAVDVPPPEPTVAKTNPPPNYILPPVAIPSFTNRVAQPPVRFTNLAATPRDLILTNERVVIKPVPQPVQPPSERLRRDKEPPRVSIQSPSEKERLTQSLLVIEGTAKDNEGLDRVEYCFNGGEVMAAEGLGQWTIKVYMRPGPNHLQVRAVDLAGNRSEWVSRTYTFLITSPMLVMINGNGDISPNLAGQLLEIGKTYTITAEPARGYTFVGWEGGVKSDQPKIEFVMRTNMVLVANFAPKAGVSGNSKQPPLLLSARVNVSIKGLGTVKPVLKDKPLEIGKSYTLTADPANGQMFAGWHGDITQSSPELTFLLRSNLSLEAHFVPNPYAVIEGEYQGLLWNTNDVAHETAGLLAINLGADGRFKGRIWTGGEDFPFSGQFDADGRANKLIVRRQMPSLRISFSLKPGDPSTPIEGVVTQGEATAAFHCDRWLKGSRENPCHWAGHYTLIMVGTGPNPGPAGDGCGQVDVDAEGRARLQGYLSDGTEIKYTGPLSTDGRLAVYVPLYGGQGSVFGWLTLGKTAAPDISGQMAWFKPAVSKDTMFPTGFRRLLAVNGCRYQPPQAGKRLLALTNGVLALSKGGLPELMGNLFELTGKNKIKVAFAASPDFNLSLNPQTGLFSGSFQHPATGKTARFHGAVLQKLNWGSGFFDGVGDSGLVFLGPDPGTDKSESTPPPPASASADADGK